MLKVTKWLCCGNKRAATAALHQLRRRFLSGNSHKTRQGFGSFHSDDAEVLIRQGGEHTRSLVYNDVSHHMEKQLTQVVEQFEFGDSQMKACLFALDGDWTFINHGAFGATLRPLLEEANHWRYIVMSGMSVPKD